MTTIIPRDGIEYLLDSPVLIKFDKTIVKGCIFRISVPEGTNLSSAIRAEGKDGTIADCIFDIVIVPIEKPAIRPSLRAVKNTARSIRMMDNKI